MILRDERRNIEHTVPDTGARLGRDPSLEIVFPEEDNVVSALHCRVYRADDGTWWLQDLESTNGTFLNGKRLSGGPDRLVTGARFSLGQRGPTLRVTVPGQVLATMAEPALDLSQPVVRLRRVKGGEDLTGTGREVVIGRAAACHIPLRTVVDTVVSKRHAVVDFDDSGAAYLADLGSRNGTYLNGRQITGRTPMRAGDRIMLGWQGPLFEVRVLGSSAMEENAGAPYNPRREPPRTLAGIVAVAEEEARAYGGGAKKPTRFVTSLLRQLATESSFAFRALTALVLILLAAGVIFVYQEGAQRTADAEARLASAERRLSEQLQQSEAAQARQSEELTNLRNQLAAARAAAVSRSVLDSLERRLRDAESRAAQPGPAPAAAPGGSSADFSTVARENGRVVGLVIVQYLGDTVMGSGFALTSSGYFVTNRHVIQNESRGAPRSISVVMAETSTPLFADVVAVSNVEEQDIAILRIRGFRGPAARSFDWQGRGAVQGAPAAMIGFPFGIQLALESGVIRAHLFGGYIAQTGDWIRFNSVTYAGVSGSPLFNQNGEVIAVHFGAAQAGPGLAVSVPMRLVRRWLPADARAELGLN